MNLPNFFKSKEKRRFRLSGWTVLTVLLLAVLGLPSSGILVPKALGNSVFPFRPGEKLYYRLKWLFIPAGEGTLEVLPYEETGGPPACHAAAISLPAWSSLIRFVLSSSPRALPSILPFRSA